MQVVMRRAVPCLFFILFSFFSSALSAQPIVTSISPVAGPEAGGNTVTINGSGFTGVTVVHFGSNSSPFTQISDTQIQATAPLAVPGNVNITVTTPSGTSGTSPADLYTHQGSWVSYLSLISGDAIAPFDAPSNTPHLPIPLSFSPGFLAVTPDGRTAYVLSNNTPFVFPIDLATNTVGAAIGPLSSNHALGGRSISITPNGLFAYIPILDTTNHISIIDLTNNTLLETTIPIPDLIRAIAITPDGTKGFVTTDAGFLYNFDVLTNILDPVPTKIDFFPLQISITPDGTLAYIICNGNGNPTLVDVVDTTTNALVTSIPLPSGVVPASVFGSPLAVGIAPNEQTAYAGFGTDVQSPLPPTNGFVSPIHLPTNILLTPFNQGIIILTPDIAATPDSAFVYISGTEGSGLPTGQLGVIDVSAGTETIISEASSTGGIGISPDQAPVSRFTITSTPEIGQSTSFDASASVTATGTIVQYIWDFGDGTTLTTTSPTVTHIYEKSGPLSVSLRVVNSAGTSTTQTYTGRMVSNNGGPTAISSQTIQPLQFVGEVVKNIFLTQIDYVHRLRWTSTSDTTIVAYFLLRNGQLLARIPINGPHVYNDHNRKKHEQDTYTLIPVNAQGVQSIPLVAVVGGGSK